MAGGQHKGGKTKFDPFLTEEKVGVLVMGGGSSIAGKKA